MTPTMLLLLLAQTPPLEPPPTPPPLPEVEAPANWAGTFSPEATASWFPTGCREVVVAAEHADAAAAAFLAALQQSKACSRVLASHEAWSPGWTLHQELLARAQQGTPSVLVVVRPDFVTLFDQRGAAYQTISISPGLPMARAQTAPPLSFTRFELHVEPLGFHANPSMNQHFVAAVTFTVRPWWFGGFYVSGLGTWLRTNGPALQRLTTERVEPTAEGLLRFNWGVQFGAEAIPLKTAIAPYVTVGAGLSSTQHMLKPENAAGPATWADTGIRPTFSFAVGARWQLARNVTLRLEVRDLLMTGDASSANGCGVQDLNSLDTAQREGRPLSTASVAPGCNVGAFSPNDIPLARNLVRNTAPVPGLHILLLNVGAGFAF